MGWVFASVILLNICFLHYTPPLLQGLQKWGGVTIYRKLRKIIGEEL